MGVVGVYRVPTRANGVVLRRGSGAGSGLAIIAPPKDALGLYTGYRGRDANGDGDGDADYLVRARATHLLHHLAKNSVHYERVELRVQQGAGTTQTSRRNMTDR